MSADNWAVCPQCKKSAENLRDTTLLEAGKAYGKVSSEKYLELVQKADAIKTPLLSETLREDYEIGIAKDGSFSVSYGASCTSCGFNFTYEFKQSQTLL